MTYELSVESRGSRINTVLYCGVGCGRSFVSLALKG